jgi:uncharacterized membrane protein
LKLERSRLTGCTNVTLLQKLKLSWLQSTTMTTIATTMVIMMMVVVVVVCGGVPAV